MARKRLFSVTVAAAVLAAGSMVFPARPATAATFGVHMVVGTMQMGNGLAYSCLGGAGVPNINVAKCQPFSPNTASISLAATAIGGIGNAPTKAGKGGTVEFGIFALNASGSARGSCNLMTGFLTGTLTPTSAVGTKAKARSFSATFTVVKKTMHITGTTNKAESLSGALKLAVTTGSCLNKGPKTWTVAGKIAPFRIP